MGLLDDKIRIFDNAEDALMADIGVTKELIFNETLKILAKVPTSGGQLVFDGSTIDLVDELEREINRAIQNSGFPSNVTQYLRDFQLITANNIALHQGLNNINIAQSITGLQRVAVEQTLNNLLGQGLQTNFVGPVRAQLYNSIVSGSTVTQAEEALKQIVVGGPGEAGTFQRYVGRIARDAIQQYDGYWRYQRAYIQRNLKDTS